MYQSIWIPGYSEGEVVKILFRRVKFLKKSFKRVKLSIKRKNRYKKIYEEWVWKIVYDMHQIFYAIHSL